METQTYLVFIRNMQSLQDFSVPAEASTSHAAQARAMTRYPTPVYMVLTAFPVAELQAAFGTGDGDNQTSSAAPFPTACAGRHRRAPAKPQRRGSRRHGA